MKRSLLSVISAILFSCASTDNSSAKTPTAVPQEREEKLVEVYAPIGKPQQAASEKAMEPAHQAKSADEYNGTPLCASAVTVILGCPAMHISSYDTEDPVEVGKLTVYVIEHRNEGTSECTNLEVINEIDDNMEFVDAEAPVEYKIEGDKIIFDPVLILQPGEKVQYRVTCKAIAPGSIKNRAILKYTEFEESIIDEEGTSVYGTE